MARRKSTIGHNPLQAISLEASSRPASVRDRPAPAKSAKPKVPAKAPPTMVTEPLPAPVVLKDKGVEDKGVEDRATEVVRSYYGWSSAAGLVPLPGLDVAAIVGVQVKMVQELARLYGKTVDKHMVRPLVVSLLGTTGGVLLAGPMARLLWIIPVVGPLVGLLTFPALAAASCWATGHVFIRHFESGGTVHDFDPAEARAHYTAQLAAAKGAA
jgi:uncharacterized protein (DUF697 family)